MKLKTPQKNGMKEKKKYPALKRHICPFNDGAHICECFDKGYKARNKEVVKQILEMKLEPVVLKYLSK